MTAPASERFPFDRAILVTGALVLVVAGLEAASAVFLPVLLALFLTILSLPLLEGLRARRVPAPLAVLLTVVAVMAVLGVVAVVLSASVGSITESLPQYEERVRDAIAATGAWFEARGMPVSDWLVVEALDLSAVAVLVGNTFREVARLVSSMLLVLLTMVFMLWESVVLPEKLRAADSPGPVDLARWTDAIERIQRYLALKTAISLATGLLVGLWVALLGLDFALFWGFVAFVLNYIPNFGSILASLPAIALALVQLGTPRAIAVAAGYLAINVLIGNLIEPAVMGRGLRLSPLAIFLGLLFWGWLWGPLGAILSVPLTVSLKIVFESTERLRWLSVLFDRRPARR